jgi:hypothetical protein
MDYSFLYFVLSAQDDDFGKWMNIFFLVIVAAFWVISGVVKVKSEQSKKQKKKQPSRSSTTGSPPSSKDPGEFILEKILGSFIPDSGNQERSSTQQTTKNPPRFQETRPRPTSKLLSEKYTMRQKMSQKRKQKLSLPKKSLDPKFNEITQIEPDIEKLPDFTTDAVKNIEPSYQKVTPGISMPHDLLDFSDSDSLKKAILYYEVLGRPLSLRDQSNPFTG